MLQGDLLSAEFRGIVSDILQCLTFYTCLYNISHIPIGKEKEKKRWPSHLQHKNGLEHSIPTGN